MNDLVYLIETESIKRTPSDVSYYDPMNCSLDVAICGSIVAAKAARGISVSLQSYDLYLNNFRYFLKGHCTAQSFAPKVYGRQLDYLKDKEKKERSWLFMWGVSMALVSFNFPGLGIYRYLGLGLILKYMKDMDFRICSDIKTSEQVTAEQIAESLERLKKNAKDVILQYID